MKVAKPVSLRRFLPTGVVLALIPGCYLMCPYNADQFVETQIRAECHFWFACCPAGEHALAAAAGFPNLGNFRDEGACVTERLEEGGFFNDLALAISQAEQGGRFKFDAATFQTCAQPRIDALNACDADFILGDGAPIVVPAECQGVSGTGLVPDGGDCFFAFECAEKGSDCLPANVLDKDEDRAKEAEDPDQVLITRPTICIKPLADGDDCSIDPERTLSPTTCEPGLICFTDSDGDQECQAPHGKGDDCNFASDCDVGLFCDLGEAPPECAELKQEGDDCIADAECDIGLQCDLADDNPECIALLPVEVEICNGVQGVDDVAYPSK